MRRRSSEIAPIAGKVLYLATPEMIANQLARRELQELPPEPALMDRVSTDEIFPSRGALERDLSRVGDYALAGLRGGCVQLGELAQSPYNVLVAGDSFGCGSSREHAPLALARAGIRLIVAKSFERIFRENCVNLGGPLVTTDMDILVELRKAGTADVDMVTASLDVLSRDIVRAGGLLHHSRGRLNGAVELRPIDTPPRLMTPVEAILAAKMTTKYGYVKPGDIGYVKTDLRFTYELFVPMIEDLLNEAFGRDWTIRSPESLLLFNDHLALMSGPNVDALRETTREFGRQHGLAILDAHPDAGAEGICHTIILERYAKVGQVIVGTDSHTCTAGAAGAVAFGIGATEMANALVTGEVRVTVPGTIRFEGAGALAHGVTPKDVMLYLLSLDAVQSGYAVGRVLEYAGPGLRTWSLDDLAVLTNMAVEAGGFTGFVDRSARGSATGQRVTGGAGAVYDSVIQVDLSRIPPMIAEPGDPRNAVPLQDRHGEVEIDLAYVGSCTSGKLADLEACAQVLRGRRVDPRVRMFVQASSRAIAREAAEKGFINDIVDAGATFLDPGCGACCGLGPGTSQSPDDVTISSTNRNFPGRMGKGSVYLANPAVVAASAVAGRIISPAYLVATQSS